LFFPFFPWRGTLGFTMAQRKLPLAAIRRAASAFPGVDEGMSYGTPAFRLKGKLLARLHQDGGSIMFKLDFATREHLMEADPATFFITDHYRNYPSVLARLDHLKPGDVRKLFARAIELAGAKRRSISPRS
jgi:hypothetical protein